MLRNPAVQEVFAPDLPEAFRQGCRQALADLRVLAGPWPAIPGWLAAASAARVDAA